jgi:hypothetical protein
MHAIQGYYDGKTIRPLEPIRIHPNVRVIITFMESETPTTIPTTSVRDVAGCLHYAGPAKSLSDMENAIQAGVKARWQ